MGIVIDARLTFGTKFIQDSQANLSIKETDNRLKIMGPAFIKMVGHAINHAPQEEINA